MENDIKIKNMVKVKEDLTGKVFGRLTVIEQVEDHIQPNGVHVAMWKCTCCCDGKEIITSGASLKNKRTLSCGCLQKEKAAKYLRKMSTKYNKIDCSGEFCIGYTSKGEEFWFDKDDYELVSQYCWSYDDCGYLQANNKNDHHIIKLHRLVMGFPDSNLYDVDHKNHPPKNEHKIDNRKSNLRIVTRSKNNMNKSLQTNNKSGVTGVCWNKRRNQWEVQLVSHKKKVFHDFFDNFEDAVIARKNAEQKYFGEYRYDANN